MPIINFGYGVQLPAVAPVGISFSGGVDSTMVLYQIISQCDLPIHLYTVAVVDRQFNHARTTLDLALWFKQRFANPLFLHTDLTDNNQEGMGQLFRQALEDLAKGRIRSLFMGVTANPPDHEHDLFASRSEAISPQRRNPNQLRPLSRSNNFHDPYTNINKAQVAQLYRDLGLMDDLFALTRSCSHRPDLSQCGQCWSCEERQWAFGRLI